MKWRGAVSFKLCQICRFVAKKNDCCFKSQSFRGVCYAAIDKYNRISPFHWIFFILSPKQTLLNKYLSVIKQCCIPIHNGRFYWTNNMTSFKCMLSALLLNYLFEIVNFEFKLQLSLSLCMWQSLVSSIWMSQAHPFPAHHQETPRVWGYLQLYLCIIKSLLVWHAKEPGYGDP